MTFKDYFGNIVIAGDKVVWVGSSGHLNDGVVEKIVKGQRFPCKLGIRPSGKTWDNKQPSLIYKERAYDVVRL